AALDHGPVDLPGPTGEANTYQLVAKGVVLCLGASDQALVAQVIAALAGGNGVIAAGPGASKLLQPLMKGDVPLAVLEGSVEPEALESLKIDLVAASGDKN